MTQAGDPSVDEQQVPVGPMALVRGEKFKVFFEGSNYFREFVVPNVAEFDLLQILSTTPDPFTIVQMPAMPIRLS